MFNARPGGILVLILVAVNPLSSQERDLRDRYGTRGLEAAKLVSQAAQLMNARKLTPALAAAEAAIKREPSCQRAYFIKALLLRDLGEVEKCIEAYKMCLSDKVYHYPRFSAMAAGNLGVTYNKLKEFEEANLWFTRTILEDHANRFGQRANAYRNLAINLRSQGRHLAAAVSLLFAYDDKAPNINDQMVRAYLEKAEGFEGASLFHFPGAAPKLAKRDAETKLTPVALEAGPPEAVARLLPDPRGRYVLALPPRAAHYYLIATDNKLTTNKITTNKPLRCACLAGGFLYAVCEEPARIDKLEPATGKVLATYALKSVLPSSLVVFPARGRAYFPVNRIVHELNLRTGAVLKTKVPGQVIVGHPNQRFLYSFLKPEVRRTNSFIIIRGRPVRIRTGQVNRLQTTLFKAVVVPSGLLLAEFRSNAASNAWRLSLSPDGNRVAVVGGGGWRPEVKTSTAGYGVAVFDAHRLERLLGFFATGPYPTGISFNPVTGQVAAVRAQDAHVYHLSAPKNGTQVQGKFTGPVAWSGNGRYLILANASGVTVLENALSTGELKLAATWWKALETARRPAAKIARATFQAVAEYTRFALVTPGRAELSKALARAIRTGRTDRQGVWPNYAPYVKDSGPRLAIAAAAPQLSSKEDVGIAIFQLKKALKRHPDSVPLRFVLAQAYRLGHQPEAAEKLYLAVVRADAGRTELSSLSLNHLATLLEGRGQGLGALHCLTASLYLDRAHPRTLAQTLRLLKKHKFEAEATSVAKLVTLVPALLTDLPKLPKPGALKKLTAAEIYRKAVVSVVLIKTDKGSGSGICVGRPDVILTNHHVINGARTIEVYAFALKGKLPERMARVSATVIYRSAKQDVAVLRLSKTPVSLRPLPVAVANPGPGDKIYTLGSPGAGKEILEQTISEGLVSSTRRAIDGVGYLQHSAAVNPGNSGGALLDEHCRVVGLVTLKARLENVSFALPAETIRAIFNSR